jgi:OOP family OmpA-OmpF porin
MSPEEGVVLAGSLPPDLDKSDVLNALRIVNHRGDLVSGGQGSADGWLDDLTHIGSFLPIFEEADISFGREGLSVRGRLYASLDVDTVASEIERVFGEERMPKLDLATTDVAHVDGTRRRDSLTGEELVHKGGFWLPVLDFDPNVRACQERSSAILEASRIEFGRGDPDIDARAEPILNRLAAVAIACFERQALELEIGGHTDSRGARSLNEELSQARADAVLRALVTRGVPDSALIAVGYGDRRPIADNATSDGRAANRRITFEWRASGIGSQAGAEG